MATTRPSRCCAIRTSLATTSSAQLRSSSTTSEKSSIAVSHSEVASTDSMRPRTATPVGRVTRLR